MESAVNIANELRKEGCNCSQAVACAFAERVGADKTMLFKATEALGGGMGCHKGTCGAVSGACIVVGLKNSSGETGEKSSKKESYAMSGKIVEGFLEKYGTCVCEELKAAIADGKIESCDAFINYAVCLTEDAVFAE